MLMRLGGQLAKPRHREGGPREVQGLLMKITKLILALGACLPLGVAVLWGLALPRLWSGFVIEIDDIDDEVLMA